MKSRFLLIVVLLALAFACTKDKENTPAPPISAVDCSGATISTTPTAGEPFTDNLLLPYTDGSGETYVTNFPIQSTGVTGLTATLQGGTLAVGSGNFTFVITGTPSEGGIASFPFAFGAATCTITLEVIDQPLVQYGTPFAGVPDPRDAVIYQVNFRAFSNSRDFQGVIDRLDEIEDLGVNVIYLMPSYPIGSLNSINSPYCVRDYKAVNPDLGDLNDLRNLIEGAHNRGMAVILDWVANHTAWDHPWITQHKNWYDQNGSGTILSPPLGWLDVAQLNYDNLTMRNEMIKSMKYWVYTVNCDGFRCDYADGPPSTFWAQANEALRAVPDHKLLMLAESAYVSNHEIGFDYIFGFSFYGTMKGIFESGASVNNINTVNQSEYSGAGTPEKQVVRYLTNHDVNFSDGTTLELFGGEAGSMAAFAVVAYMKSVPMIYNGQEVGTTFPLAYLTNGTTINWNQNPAMLAEYKKIIAFRNASTAIRRGALFSYSNSEVCAFTKTSGTEEVLVISNLRNAPRSVDFPLGSGIDGTWTDAFTGNPYTIVAGQSVPLAAYEYLVLTR